MTTAEAAKVLGVPASTVRVWVTRGKLRREEDGTISLASLNRLILSKRIG